MDIYQYEDYRLFLADSFAARKADDPDYTHRKLAAAAGFSNPGFFNDVVKGRRTLSDTAITKMAQAFELKGGAAEYFQLLVAYGQSKRPEERQELYEKMLFRRNRSSFVRLNPTNSKYYQDYHYPLIRSAIAVFDFRGNYEELARFIRPPLPVNTVKRCVRELCEWGLVQQSADGKYTVANRNQEPAASMNDLVKRLNREWVIQAADALFTYSKTERHISSGLLSVSQNTAQEIFKRIDAFREEIIDLARREENPEQVLQFNIQLFPRTAARARKSP